MSYRVTAATTTSPLLFLMVQSADHITALTGASPTVTISKNGGAFGSPSGAVSELANGWYKVAGNATDNATVGPLLLHATAASGDPTDMVYEVVAQDLSTATVALVTTVSGNVNGSVGSVTGAVGSVTGAVGSVTGAVGSVTGNVGGNVTGSVGSVAAGGITNSSLAANTGLKPLLAGTASAGSGTSITLTGGVATNGYYNNCLVVITGGTGIGQARFISAYVGSTTVATVSTWATNPDNTSTFAVLPFDAVAGASAPTVAQIATGIWTDLMAGSDFATAGSVGALLLSDLDTNIGSRASPTNITAGTITTVTNLTNAPTAGDFTAAMKTSLNAATPASVQNQSATTGDAYAEVVLVKADTAAIKIKTDQLAFTTANHVDAGVKDINGTTVNGNGSTTPWGP